MCALALRSAVLRGAVAMPTPLTSQRTPLLLLLGRTGRYRRGEAHQTVRRYGPTAYSSS